jgi:hypothetical protein
MFGRVSSPIGPNWICYVCALNGQHVIEGRQLFTLRFTSEQAGEGGAGSIAEVMGSFGTFVTGRPTYSTADTDLTVGEHEFTINDCTKDFLKITSKTERTSYLFIAQQSRSYTPF